jgi:hypothetical protein
MIDTAILAGIFGQYGVHRDRQAADIVHARLHRGGEDRGIQGIYPGARGGRECRTARRIARARRSRVVEGRLAYRKGKTKESGRLEVVCFGVSRLTPAAITSNT